mmetsp:Transcript_32343/g.108972  ORF Transcript_32343/g.108972 Transcript_32343/m.108972 type:complete len:223 (-) Transcript_32343:1671-2339(-)
MALATAALATAAASPKSAAASAGGSTTTSTSSAKTLRPDQSAATSRPSRTPDSPAAPLRSCRWSVASKWRRIRGASTRLASNATLSASTGLKSKGRTSSKNVCTAPQWTVSRSAAVCASKRGKRMPRISPTVKRPWGSCAAWSRVSTVAGSPTPAALAAFAASLPPSAAASERTSVAGAPDACAAALVSLSTRFRTSARSLQPFNLNRIFDSLFPALALTMT